MVEHWKDIEMFNGKYQVSNLGRVKTTASGLVLTTRFDSRGYPRLNLRDGKYKKTRTVHRLVAEAFIPNPNNLPEVNHKDENKTNNRVDNLEWCDSKYNLSYGTARLRSAISRGKPVAQYLQDGNIVCEYDSIVEASIATGISKNHIGRCCRGERRTTGGFVFNYPNGRSVNNKSLRGVT